MVKEKGTANVRYPCAHLDGLSVSALTFLQVYVWPFGYPENSNATYQLFCEPPAKGKKEYCKGRTRNIVLQMVGMVASFEPSRSAAA